MGNITSLVNNHDTSSYILSEIWQSPARSIRFQEVLSNLEMGTKGQFITAFQAFETNPGSDPYDVHTTPFAVWDFALQNEGELMSLISIPEEFQSGYVFKKSEDGTVLCSVTVTPAGTISEPHLDQTGSATLLFQVLNTKLFCIWPPTEHNLEWFKNKYGIVSGTILEAALDALENPFCLLLKQGDYYLLPLGCIHCVLSPTNAAVAGIAVVHNDFRTEAYRVMKWERDLLHVRRSQAATSVEKRSVKAIEDGLASDEALWAQVEHQVI